MRFSPARMAKLAAAGALMAAIEPFLAERRMRSDRRPAEVWSPPRGEGYLIRNAEIVDVLTGAVLHRRGILVRDGRIEDILTEKKAAEIGGMTSLDAGGRFVIPGLINAHCHMILTSTLRFGPQVVSAAVRQFERNFEECITHGVTTVRDVGTLPLQMRRFMEAVEGGRLLGPRVVHAGSFINAPGGYPDFLPPLPGPVARKVGEFGFAVRTPAEAVEAVERNAELGASFIKTAFDDRSLFVGQKPLNILDDASLRALVEAAHARGMKVSVHHRFRRGFQRALEFGVDGLEHLPSDQLLEAREVEEFTAGERFIVPTVQVGWALCGASHADPYLDHPLVRQALAHRLEVVRTLYPAMCEPAIHRELLRFEKRYRDPGYTERKHLLFTLDPKIFTEALVNGQENLNRLYHAGALIGCGNDGGTPQGFPGGLGVEMVLMEFATDMTPLHVLQAATINNARILGMEDDLGTVAKGKLADLVLLHGNPLENMENVLFPAAVFKEGRLLYATHNPEMVPA
ncbi:MAG: amidohydrolase family protein [Actinobacteria bacterium]|nr:amidohydrolase family protein [Actinomycetota bacterium]MDI6831995.1 amidohydrolase family protein [Actinomycetota bacterium]